MKILVQNGDTLSGLTRQALSQSGQSKGSALDFRSLMSTIHKVAERNEIRDPNLIFPGQVIDFTGLAMKAGPNAAFSGANVPAYAGAHAPTVNNNRVAANDVAAVVLGERTGSQYRLMERTLDRAVSKGYIPREDVADVRRRILDMSREHRFNPDDFARVVLMESDGLNPKASNGSCHGVIQFCDGPDRGAASAGFGKNPEKILDLSVLEQMDLVDRYFKDTGLAQYKPASLDNLYLTVLYPAGRSERQMHQPLGVPGIQASALHVGGLQGNPITRASLRKGLIENATVRLNAFALEQANAAPVRMTRRDASTRDVLALRH